MSAGVPEPFPKKGTPVSGNLVTFIKELYIPEMDKIDIYNLIDQICKYGMKNMANL